MVEHNDRPRGQGAKSHADGGLSGQIFGDGRNNNRLDTDRGGGNRGNDTRTEPPEPGRLNQPRLDNVRPNALSERRDGRPEPGRLNQPRLDHVHPNLLNEQRGSHPEPGRLNQPILDHVHPNRLNEQRESHPEPGRLNQPRMDLNRPGAAPDMVAPRNEQRRPSVNFPDLPPQNNFRPQNNFSPSNNFRPNAGNIIGQVVNDLINPNGRYGPGYQPGFNPGYGPRFQPGFNPGYDPRFQPGPGFNPGYDPRYQPGLDPRYQPGYDPRYQPGLQPGFRPGASVQGIIGGVVRDLIAPPVPPCNPYAPDYNPNIYQPGRIGPSGPLRNLLRQGLSDLQNNPRVLEGLVNNLGSLSPEMRLNVDRDRREVRLGMAFNRAYDLLTRQQGAPDNPELRRVLAGLDSVQLNPDALALNWKSEQLVALDQQPNGPRDIRLLLGGDTNRTTLNIETSETALRLSNIQGLEAVDPSGRRLRIHGVDVDASDPREPRGIITIDNPIPPPSQLPPGAVWPEQVGLPIPITTENQKQAVPRLISQLHNARTAANNGDFGQMIGSINPQELSTLLGMLKPQPQPNPMVPEPPQPGIQPDVPPPPQPGIQPDVPPPPQPGLIEENPVPTIGDEPLPEVPQPGPQPGYDQQQEVPPPPLPGITEVKPNSPGVVDYLDVLPSRPPLAPRETEPLMVTPNAIPELIQPVQPPMTPPQPEKPHATAREWDFKTIDSTLYPSASILFRPSKDLAPKLPELKQPAVPAAEVQAPEAQPSEVQQPIATPEAQPEAPRTAARQHGGVRSSDILRDSGIKVTAAEKIGPDKLFSLVFADADQHGPIVAGFKSRIQDVQFRQDLDTVGKNFEPLRRR